MNTSEEEMPLEPPPPEPPPPEPSQPDYYECPEEDYLQGPDRLEYTQGLKEFLDIQAETGN